jgi:hypothetical protein
MMTKLETATAYKHVIHGLGPQKLWTKGKLQTVDQCKDKNFK